MAARRGEPVTPEVALQRKVAERRDRADLAAGRYDQLCARYLEVVNNTVRSIIRTNEADRQEAASITWVRLLQEWRRGKTYKAPVAVVVITVAKWEARGVAKASMAHLEQAVPLADMGWIEGPDAYREVEAIDWMESLFCQLPPRDRQVMELRYLEEMPPAHIAEYLGMEPNAVHQAQHRAVRALRLIENA